MSGDLDPFEERLAEGLNRLAGNATASADAFERIESGLVVHRSPRADPVRSRRVPRRHTHRRGRLALLPAGGMAVVLIVAALVADRSAHKDSRTVIAQPAPAPKRTGAGDAKSTMAAPSGAGPLALLTEHRLIAAVPGAVPVAITAPGIANAHWSADGQYLSYTSSPSPSGPDELHIAAADGSGDRTVARGHFFAIAWSGTGHQLAVRPEVRKGVGGLIVIPADGTPRQVVPRDVKVFSFAWSTHGTALAYSAVGTGGAGDEVRTVDTNTGATATVSVGPRSAGIVLARWWPDDKGLLWWLDPDHSVNLEAKGLMLQTSALKGAPRDLVGTLVYLPWLAFSPDGRTLALVAGTGDLPWKDKHLDLCDPVAATCTSVAAPPGAVALDPAWSPDGRHLAYVVAAAEGQAGAGNNVIDWYPSRHLWTADADGTRPAEVPGVGGGVSGPSWAPTGDLIRYSTANSIEVVPAGGGAPDIVATGLAGGSGSGPDGFGKVPWRGLALWAD